MNKRAKEFAIFCLLCGFAYLLTPKEERGPCSIQSEFDSTSFYGIVVNKYLDSTQHSVPIIEVKDFLKKKIVVLDFFGDRSFAFDSIRKGDTLLKDFQNSKIFRVREDNQELVGSVDFGCTDPKNL